MLEWEYYGAWRDFVRAPATSVPALDQGSLENRLVIEGGLSC